MAFARYAKAVLWRASRIRSARTSTNRVVGESHERMRTTSTARSVIEAPDRTKPPASASGPDLEAALAGGTGYAARGPAAAAAGRLTTPAAGPRRSTPCAGPSPSARRGNTAGRGPEGRRA